MLKENLSTAFKSILCQMAAAAGFVVAVAILLSGCGEDDSNPLQPPNDNESEWNESKLPEFLYNTWYTLDEALSVRKSSIDIVNYRNDRFDISFVESSGNIFKLNLQNVNDTSVLYIETISEDRVKIAYFDRPTNYHPSDEEWTLATLVYQWHSSDDPIPIIGKWIIPETREKFEMDADSIFFWGQPWEIYDYQQQHSNRNRLILNNNDKFMALYWTDQTNEVAKFEFGEIFRDTAQIYLGSDTGNWQKYSYVVSDNILDYFPLYEGMVQKYAIEHFRGPEGNLDTYWLDKFEIKVLNQQEIDDIKIFDVSCLFTKEDGDFIDNKEYRFVIYNNQIWNVDSLFDVSDPNFDNSELIIEGYYLGAKIFPGFFSYYARYKFFDIYYNNHDSFGLTYYMQISTGAFSEYFSSIDLEINVGITEATFQNRSLQGSTGSGYYFIEKSLVTRLE